MQFSVSLMCGSLYWLSVWFCFFYRVHHVWHYIISFWVWPGISTTSLAETIWTI